MIRVCIFTYSNKAYGLDISNWENIKSESGWYNSQLEEDLIERVLQGDILMYFDTHESALDWCENNKYLYEIVESNDNN